MDLSLTILKVSSKYNAVRHPGGVLLTDFLRSREVQEDLRPDRVFSRRELGLPSAERIFTCLFEEQKTCNDVFR